jgi:hypothetical protein
MATFVKTDLLVSQARIDQITSALANATQTDPITAMIAEEMARVDNLTNKLLDDASYKRLVRALVMWKLFATGSIGPMPDEIKHGYEEALKELNDIRDRKQANPALVGSPSGQWGSTDKVK